MKSVVKEFELQIDEKPNGYVIRLNDKDECVLRICQIPKEVMHKANLVDIVYSDTHPKFIRNIDWDLLRQQKKSLLEIIAKRKADPKRGHFFTNDLEGIVELLDALQDYAADDMELGDKKIFNLEDNVEES